MLPLLLLLSPLPMLRADDDLSTPMAPNTMVIMPWSVPLTTDTPADGYRLNIQNPVAVQEKLCVFVRCSFSIPDGSSTSQDVIGSWYREIEPTVPICTNKGGNVTVSLNFKKRAVCHGKKGSNDCSFSIENVKMKDSGVFYFTATIKSSPVRFADDVTLIVEESLSPRVRMSYEMEAGHNETVACSMPRVCRWERRPFFFWTVPGPSYLAKKRNFSSEVVITPRHRDHGDFITCHVAFQHVNVNVKKSVQMNVICDPYASDLCEPNEYGWIVLLLVGSIVEAIVMGLLGAFLEYRFHTVTKVTPAPVRADAPRPEARAAPKALQESTEENLSEPGDSDADVSALDADEEQSGPLQGSHSGWSSGAHISQGEMAPGAYYAEHPPRILG